MTVLGQDDAIADVLPQNVAGAPGHGDRRFADGHDGCTRLRYRQV